MSVPDSATSSSLLDLGNDLVSVTPRVVTAIILTVVVVVVPLVAIRIRKTCYFKPGTSVTKATVARFSTVQHSQWQKHQVTRSGYCSTHGEKMGKVACMVIASMGQRQPSDVQVARRTRDIDRAREAEETLNREGRGGYLAGIATDVGVIHSLITQDSLKDFCGKQISLHLDLPDNEQNKMYYKDCIKTFLKECTAPGALIWYAGHGEEETGNWVFKDGTISFQEIFDLYKYNFLGKLLYIVSDCCYAGNWVYACANALDTMCIPPCGHKAREKGIHIKVFTSCQPGQRALDPCFSKDGAEITGDGHITFWMGREIAETQKPLGGDFTKLVCCQTSGKPCDQDTYKNWTWKEALDGEMRNHIYLVRGKHWGLPAWHYVVLREKGESFVSRFNQGGTMDVAEWGHVLLSGWGKHPPQKAVDQVFYWTRV